VTKTYFKLASVSPVYRRMMFSEVCT